MVQRAHGPVAGQMFFDGSGTSPAQGTVQIPGDISIENVSITHLLRGRHTRMCCFRLIG